MPPDAVHEIKYLSRNPGCLSRRSSSRAEDLQKLERHKSTLELDIRRIDELRRDITRIDQLRRGESAAYAEGHRAEDTTSNWRVKQSRAKNNASNSKEAFSSPIMRHSLGSGDQASSSKDEEPGSRKHDLT